MMWKKLIAVGLFFAALEVSQAQAAQTRVPITSVHLQVDSEIVSGASGGRVNVTTSDSEFEIEGVEVLNEEDEWIGGMRPRISVELRAYDGYYFSGKSKSLFSFSGDDVSYSTARLQENKTELVVTLKLDKLENGDLTVTDAYWDESDGTAVWTHNPNAKYYQVKLYRDDSSVSGTCTTEEHYYEFSSKFTRRGDYYFEVRAVGSGSEKGEWESSDIWYVSAAEADDISGDLDESGSSRGPGVTGNISSENSWGPGVSGGASSVSSTASYSGNSSVSTGGHWCLDQRGWWYEYSNRTYPVNCWQCIDGRYYCFNESGYLRYGWIYWENKWYYTGSDGALMANVRTPDGYYVGGDGVWIP